MPADVSDSELLAWFDESLPLDRLAVIEGALRADPALRARAQVLANGRDAGQHSVGEVWRRERLSCPSRQQLGSYLLGALDSGWHDYITFHLQVVGCRYCRANLDDLQSSAAVATSPVVDHRRQKFFQSSAGYIRSPIADD